MEGYRSDSQLVLEYVSQAGLIPSMAQMDVIEAESMSAEAIEIIRKEGLSFPVRALVMLIVVLMLVPTFALPFDF